jgi:hypothetical protein
VVSDERRLVCARCGHEVPTCPRCGRSTGSYLGGGRSTPNGDGTWREENFCHGVDGTEELRRRNGGTCYELSTRLTIGDAFARYADLLRDLPRSDDA